LEPLLKMNEICQYLGVSRDTVTLFTETDSTFPAKKIGGQWKCKRQALEDWVDAQSGKPKHRNTVDIPRRGRPLSDPIRQVAHGRR
jgi:excisionase family DNA binding protein